MSKPKCYFAGVPARAYLDRRLDGGRRDLLGAACLHDRLGCGQGAWASEDTLADLCGLHPVVVRRYVGELIAWGYLKAERLASDKRKRVLRVVYIADADRAALSRKTRPVGHRSASAAQSGDYRSAEKSVTSGSEIRNLANSQDIESQRGDASQYSKYEESAAASPVASHAAASPPPAPPDGRNSAEAAPPFKNSGGDVVYDSTDGAFLRTLQGWLRSFDAAEATETIDQLRAWRDRCEAIAEAKASHTGGIGGWAYRLGEDLQYLIGELEEEEPTEPDNQESTGLDAVNQPSAGPPLRFGRSGDCVSPPCNGVDVGSAGTSSVPSHQRTGRKPYNQTREPVPNRAAREFLAERRAAGIADADVARIVGFVDAAGQPDVARVRDLDAGLGRWAQSQRQKVRAAITARREPEILLAIDGGQEGDLRDRFARRWYGVPFAALGTCERRRVLSDADHEARVRQQRSATRA